MSEFTMSNLSYIQMSNLRYILASLLLILSDYDKQDLSFKISRGDKQHSVEVIYEYQHNTGRHSFTISVGESNPKERVFDMWSDKFTIHVVDKMHEWVSGACDEIENHPSDTYEEE